jgi:hypothetical protein
MTNDRYIPRHLSWIDKNLKTHRVGEHQLPDLIQPLVILGEPGIGKTLLMEKLGEQPGFRFVRATSFLREGNTPKADRLVIDGLDEVAAVKEGDPLHNVLAKLGRCGKPSFVLSCRSAEWRGVTATTDIVDDYGATPLELTLEPLTRDEALTILSRDVAADNAKTALDSLDEADLGDMYKNPLLLGFVSAVIKAHGTIPRTRAKLYAHAVGRLRLEQNPRLANANLAKLSEDAALDAAGAAMAAWLLTGKESLIKNAEPGDDRILPTAELDDLVDVDDVNTVLGSNLFKPEGRRAGKFAPLHRTVAEYLGARWLAKKVDDSGHQTRVIARLFALMAPDGGVPASLRGLHAWLPRFSPRLLGPKAINLDPYGVLRYGDTDGLSVEQARHLLRALKDLSTDDPYFSSGHWGRLSARGLVQSELGEEIRDILIDTDAAAHLRSVLLECLVGSNLSKQLHKDLLEIAREPERVFHERATSVESLAKLEDSTIDWPALAKDLIGLADESSHRLAVQVLTEVGIQHFDDALIADIVIARSGILSKEKREDRHSWVGSFHSLSKKIPNHRINGVLDALAQRILPDHNVEKWWQSDHNWEARRAITTLSEDLIERQLKHDPGAVSPQRLWDWLRALVYENGHPRDDHTAIAEFLRCHDDLRRGVQRLALFGPGATNKLPRAFHLGRLSIGLQIQDSDTLTFLREIAFRKDPSDRDMWRAFVNQFRTAQGVREDVQVVARPYAGEDSELIEFLTSNRKNPLEEEERKFKRQQRERERREEETRTRIRKEYSEHIDEVRAGVFRWVYDPARAYLNMFSDLNREATPAERIAEWLGDELRDAALEGFETVLHKSDLPTAKQVAESYAESKVWNYIYPMLAGVGQRMFAGRGFSDLSSDLLSALAVAAEQELLDDQRGLKGLSDALRAELRRNDDLYEAHVRQRFEPHFRGTHNKHIIGLYSFVRSVDERPLSTRLALEWLSAFTDLPRETEYELVECIVGASREEYPEPWKRLADITRNRLSMNLGETQRVEFWQSLQFLLDPDTAIGKIPAITHETRQWFWSIMGWFHDRLDRRGYAPMATIPQLKWILGSFRSVWPFAERPSGVSSGTTNPWDATNGIRWAINQLATNPSEAAGAALAELRKMPTDGYTNEIQAAIAQQRRVRLEAYFQSPSLLDLKAALENTPPRSAADVQTIVCDELTKLQHRVRGDPLNLVNNFYTDQGKPKTENECRDQMLIALGGLPFGIQVLPETAMPQGSRSDVAFVFSNITVPLEAKGQWHKEVWTAAASQLDRYSIHHQAASKGIYVVFWFGPGAPPGKRIKGHPEGVPTPRTAVEMKAGLERLLPSYRRGDVAIIVLDLTRPKMKANPSRRKAKAKTDQLK